MTSQFSDGDATNSILRPRHRSIEGHTTFSSPSTMIKFFISDENNTVEFIVHKETACNISPAFNAAFNGQMLEGQIQQYFIDDTTVRAFRLLTQYMYSHKIRNVQLGSEWHNTVEWWEEHKDIAYDENMSLARPFLPVELWVLADKYQIPKLQNLAMTALLDVQYQNLTVTPRS
ncbi:uncharacterized protein LY89DRAFT_777844 [Mollisia scopiformis]|uniref:BTB domain-containing protein n=1 Tax=Mollisia scopiformis TaxID=149040 RepID=A0A194XRN5_MOLSC|nr:uncharacterized protein LY89DRAFT_777844 [Mollisia scopiformis]KUJ22811.1 hypothetical protein LY89DRAFT_777844 [Mollisia scopiformis]